MGSAARRPPVRAAVVDAWTRVDAEGEGGDTEQDERHEEDEGGGRELDGSWRHLDHSGSFPVQWQVLDGWP